MNQVRNAAAGRPVVAIVGRPNVGKSALFNRLVGGRPAIVHEEAGVTRDRLSREIAWGGRRIELVDTGGIGTMDDAASVDEVERAVQEQVETALAEAAAAILVTDITAGVAPLDRDVALQLRRAGRPAAVAANKADDAARDVNAAEFEILGFPVFPVSAIHNRGLEALMAFVLERVPDGPLETAAKPVRVTVVGRPNVGKSSYINRLLRANRVIVSAQPGTTRDSVDVPFTIGRGETARRYVLTDTAGMRRKRRLTGAVERFSLARTERAIREADIVVLILDGSGVPSLQDRKIAGCVLRHLRPCVAVVNKWDLRRDLTQRAYCRELARALPFADFVPVTFVSAKTGYNIRRTVDAIEHVAARAGCRLATGSLNRCVHEAYDRVQPPAARGRRLKLYYAAQVSNRPFAITLFVNDPRLVSAPYLAYLASTIRRTFGLDGIPIDLRLRSRRETSRPT